MNLEYVKPFANTSDLVNKAPYIHPSQARKVQEEAKKKAEEEKLQGATATGEKKTTIEMEE